MAILLNWQQVEKQSQNVFNQFGESKWIPFAKENIKQPHKSTKEFHNAGIGKTLLLCAMGESLEKQVDIIKRYRDKVDIVVCDKGFEPLLKQGIKADFVMLCDCNISFRFIEKSINETKGVKLICTPYANPEWVKKWQGDRYFFVNKDAIKTEKIFKKMFDKDLRIIPAGSNVSNAMLVFFTGSDEVQNINFSGYEKYLLVGYDYSWSPFGKYYAWHNPKPKRFYMNHRTMIDFNNNIVFTSENLLFSAKWLYSYITTFQINAINCSGEGLFDIPQKSVLEKELKNLNKIKENDCKNAFDLMKNCYFAYQKSIDFFNKTRRALTCQ